MRKRSALWCSCAAALLAIGCATAKPAPPPPPAPIAAPADACEEILNRPDLLLARAEATRAKDERALAYRYYALVHQLHPQSREDADAFLWAARLGKRFAEVDLFWKPNSIWSTAERFFLYQWFEELASGDTFPEQHARALLVDASYGLAQLFLEHAAKRPALARWNIEVDEDNGRVYAVRFRPLEPEKKRRAR